MKVSVAVICFLLFILIITDVLGDKTKPSSGEPYHHPTECCFTYATRTIRRQRIADYYETSSQCAKPGVVFITRKGYLICANPSEDWVQDYIKELERPRSSGEGHSSESYRE